MAKLTLMKNIHPDLTLLEKINSYSTKVFSNNYNGQYLRQILKKIKIYIRVKNIFICYYLFT